MIGKKAQDINNGVQDCFLRHEASREYCEYLKQVNRINSGCVDEYLKINTSSDIFDVLDIKSLLKLLSVLSHEFLQIMIMPLIYILMTIYYKNVKRIFCYMS